MQLGHCSYDEGITCSPTIKQLQDGVQSSDGRQMASHFLMDATFANNHAEAASNCSQSPLELTP